MIQELDEMHHPLMYKIIKDMQLSSRGEINAVRDNNDRILSGKEDIAEYIQEQ